MPSKSIRRCEIPADALLAAYARGGGFADCYVTETPRLVSHAEFVEAFYTTALFKVERLILRLAAGRPSTDADARQLARAGASTFAAWGVEGRAENQLLLADFSGRTRSWLMVSSPGADHAGSRLFFGSAVVPSARRGQRQPTLGPTFRLLLGFHRLYSRALLSAARRRLMA